MQKTSDLIWQDTQHQVLFELIEQLASDEADYAIIDRLVEYTENHFFLEEVYMEKLSFPGKDEHIQAHNKFRCELNDLAVNQHEYNQELRKALSVFLTEWLKRHVLGIDKELEAFILSSSSK